MANSRYIPDRVEINAGPVPFPQRGQRSGERAYTRMALSETMDRPSAGATAAPVDEQQVAFEQAKQSGYEAGLAEGRAQAEREVSELLASWQASVNDVLGARQVVLEAYRQELVELALVVADAIVQRHIAREPDFSQHLVEQAFATLGRAEAFTLTLCPQDAEELDAWLHQLAETGCSVVVQRDESLGRGDLRLRTATGSVESLMSERVARARQLVLGDANRDDPPTEPTP
ncbi:MAG: hypothetical protein B7733_09510 [Myxococcales bacterium FL481]|nr:MAG: hypothetical protein B7733_09510 [Myxococcales bacterium FL481]